MISDVTICMNGLVDKFPGIGGGGTLGGFISDCINVIISQDDFDILSPGIVCLEACFSLGKI